MKGRDAGEMDSSAFACSQHSNLWRGMVFDADFPIHHFALHE